MKLRLGTLFKNTFLKLVVFTSLVVLGSALGFFLLEGRDQELSFFSSIWWTVVTVASVGYGDLVPKSVPGQLLGIVVIFSGLGLVSTLTGSMASFLVERHAKQRKGLLKVKLTDHVIILGWNSYGPNLVKALAKTLLERSSLVLVNDLPPDAREELSFKMELGEKLHFVFGNPTQENVLHRASPASAKLVYILIQEGLSPKEADQQSLYAALTLRSLAPKVLIYAEVAREENREHLLRAGVNETVVQGEITSLLLGMLGANPSMWPFFQSLLGAREEGCLAYRSLSHEERGLTWGDFLKKAIFDTGILPLALCHQSKDLSLQDMLDEGSALDQFILELFQATGQQTDLGRQGPSVIVNPVRSQPLEHYDGILFLKPAVQEA
jgi:voltage-gated potassium channel